VGFVLHLPLSVDEFKKGFHCLAEPEEPLVGDKEFRSFNGEYGQAVPVRPFRVVPDDDSPVLHGSPEYPRKYRRHFPLRHYRDPLLLRAGAPAGETVSEEARCSRPWAMAKERFTRQASFTRTGQWSMA